MLNAAARKETHPNFSTRTLLLDRESPDDSPEKKRQALKRYFNDTFELYEHLFELIETPASYYKRPEPLRHPLIFYYGHTATFFINKLMLAQLIEQRVNPEFESTFAIGVDEMSWDDLNDAHYDWPSVEEVKHYRDRVKAVVNRVIDKMPIKLPITQEDPAWVILMGIEHERIHLETSSVIIRMLPIEDIVLLETWKGCTDVGAAPSTDWITFEAGAVELGKPETDQTYGWDNEYGCKSVEVDRFKASTHLITNAAFLAFIQAGGYQAPELWTEEGQQWLVYTKATMPRFWLKRDGAYWQRNLAEEIPLPLNWPVEVNYLEAKAYCQWLAEQTAQHIRLPTEAEWSMMRRYLKEDQPTWQKAPGNINLEHFASSCPVDRFKMLVDGTAV